MPTRDELRVNASLSSLGTNTAIIAGELKRCADALEALVASVGVLVTLTNAAAVEREQR